MNVKVVQRRLWEQSRQHRNHRDSSLPLFPVDRYERRARNLMDLMHQPQWIAAACDRVLSRSRGKAGGVDRITASEFRQNRRANLESLRLELKRGTYSPQPLRRTVIPKANGKLRKLGIPCLRDKIVQEAIRMALEPIFEVEFHHSSYGFRPNRSTHHAVLRCQQMLQKRFTWVIDVPSATAILDRFLADSEVIQVNGRSYRLDNSRNSSNSTKAPTGSTAEDN